MVKGDQIRKGDIVKIDSYDGEDETITKQCRAISSMSPDRLAIMRIIDENTVLVALCKLEPRKTTSTFKTNVGEVHIHTKCFYAVDLNLISQCGVYLLNSYETVSKIYELHNQWVEDSKKRRELKRRRQKEIRRKNAIKKELRYREKRKKREAEMQYAKAYEMAIINNDKKEMGRIEKIVGHPPCQSSKGYSSLSHKISYKIFNPKPLSGGRFSPQ